MLSDPGLQPDDFEVDIDWGDRTGTTKGCLLRGHGNQVAGRHAYASPGKYLVTVAVTGPKGITQTATSRIEVGDLYAGVQEEREVGAFKDPHPAVRAPDYRATIDWGDSTPPVPGVIRRAEDGFRIRGSHRYRQDGLYVARTLVTGPEGGVRLWSRCPLTVVRSQITSTIDNVMAMPLEPVADRQVGTLVVPSRDDSPDQFGAEINWGDGTPLDDDAVIVGRNGFFRVLAGHTYEDFGTFGVTLGLWQVWH